MNLLRICSEDMDQKMIHNIYEKFKDFSDNSIITSVIYNKKWK